MFILGGPRTAQTTEQPSGSGYVRSRPQIGAHFLAARHILQIQKLLRLIGQQCMTFYVRLLEYLI